MDTGKESPETGTINYIKSPDSLRVSKFEYGYDLDIILENVY